MRVAGLIAAICLLEVTGCATHVPPLASIRGSEFQRIGWRADLAEAAERARHLNRPLLVVAVAGARAGNC